MIQEFEGKVAIITGGTHGIGFSLAKNFLDLGMSVIITGSKSSSVEEAETKLNNNNLIAVVSDAGNENANFELAELVRNKFGKISLLCLNAGISGIAQFDEFSIENWKRHIDINLNGPFYGVKAFKPLLDKEESHIVITSSIFSFITAPMQCGYFASKAGLSAFAEALYFDLKMSESNIGVSLLCPGNTRTNMAEANLTGNEDPELAKAVRDIIANGDDPQIITNATIDAIRKDKFYVMPNTGIFKSAVETRFDRIMNERNPKLEDVKEII